MMISLNDKLTTRLEMRSNATGVPVEKIVADIISENVDDYVINNNDIPSLNLKKIPVMNDPKKNIKVDDIIGIITDDDSRNSVELKKELYL